MSKYLSYLLISKDGQFKIKEWHTVEVVENGLKVKNRNGVEIGIGPFLRLNHFFHDDPNPDLLGTAITRVTSV